MRCEDYPCCGHTDGLPCDWTYTPEAQAFDRIHAFCDHEAGFCEVDYAIDSVYEDSDCCDSGDANFSTARQRWECAYCGEPVDGPERDDMEDAWLDGYYEE